MDIKKKMSLYQARKVLVEQLSEADAAEAVGKQRTTNAISRKAKKEIVDAMALVGLTPDSIVKDLCECMMAAKKEGRWKEHLGYLATLGRWMGLDKKEEKNESGTNALEQLSDSETAELVAILREQTNTKTI